MNSYLSFLFCDEDGRIIVPSPSPVSSISLVSSSLTSHSNPLVCVCVLGGGIDMLTCQCV